jgi:hypothetical protein
MYRFMLFEWTSVSVMLGLTLVKDKCFVFTFDFVAKQCDE